MYTPLCTGIAYTTRLPKPLRFYFLDLIVKTLSDSLMIISLVQLLWHRCQVNTQPKRDLIFSGRYISIIIIIFLTRSCCWHCPQSSRNFLVIHLASCLVLSTNNQQFQWKKKLIIFIVHYYCTYFSVSLQ